MDTGKEMELLDGNLLLLNAKLVLELSLGRTLDSLNSIGEIGAGLARHSQRVRAACVGPHIGEGDLLGSALLKEQLVLVVEQEDGEGTV
jgi:hypothetical protein